jgi:membrane fusion protein (multidrug efflux system)
MKKRMVIMLAAVIVFIVVLGVVKFLQIRAAIAQGSSFQPPPEAVTTIVARMEEWPATLSTIGTVVAVHGVTVSADLPGIVRNIDFTSGKSVQAGQVLVRLDTSQERAQLSAAESSRDLAKLNLDRLRTLLERQVIAQAEFDRIQAEAKSAEARVGEIRATIERKRIRAPFAGILGIRQVSLGQYLNSGDPVVPLQSMDPVYVNFSLPQRDIGSLKTGATVNISADSASVFDAEGKITAINSIIDEATRNVEVQATFKNPRARLRPGMFVEVNTKLGASDSVIALPASAINYAPYGNSVFVVADLKAPDGKPYRGVQQRFVKLGGGRGDQVAVASGIQAGEEVVTSGVFKLRNGAAVMVNNEVQPSNDPAPKPEDS